uniref:Heparan-alpha-glucosaminide N-acetyltransferase catalytic domain-containing protein n=1 Tax=Salix viminalis TaxID=40686 RepID=A0A6N2LDG1_SALVM
MPEIKADTASDHRLTIADVSDISAQKPDPKIRVASLDIFRGLTVALMILVDDAGGEWPKIGHAPWNGCNLADFVMPFLLLLRITSRLDAVKKVIGRTLKLLFWGIILQGGFSHAPDKLTYGVDMKKIRWCGILQRIAFAYLVVALIEIFTKKEQTKELPPGWPSIFKLYSSQWLMGACILVIYVAAIYGTYVPNWQFTVQDRDSADYGKVFTVECSVRGKLDPPCNAVGFIDRKILGINHMYQHPAWKRSEACTDNSPYEGPFRTSAPSWCKAPFEPEGILSYVCVTSGAAALVFSSIYALCMFQPLAWIGMNAMLVYVMAAEGIFAGFINGWYYNDPHNTLIYWIQKHIFIGVWHSQRVGILLYVIFAEILFWGMVAGIFHRLEIYWKL